MPLGSKNFTTANNLSNFIDFAIERKLTRVNTLILAKITEIDNEGLGDERLSVQPLINMVSGDDQSIPPPISYNIPSTRIRGGNAGIIIQYKVGDTCLIAYCDRDITAIKRTGESANPTSLRLFNLADAIIVAHWSNTLPQIYIKITDDIIDIKRDNAQLTMDDTQTIVKYGSNSVKIDNTGVTIQGNTVINGNLQVNGTGEFSGTVTTPDVIKSTEPLVTAFTHIHNVSIPGKITGPPIA